MSATLNIEKFANYFETENVKNRNLKLRLKINK